MVRDIWEDPAAKVEFDSLGLEVVPVAVFGDRTLAIAHVDQLRDWLGMPAADPGAEYLDLVRACDRVLRAFEQTLLQIPDQQISTPTPNRGRSMREMMHVFARMAEATAALDTGRFSFQAILEAEKGTRLTTAREMARYAIDIRVRWLARSLQVTADKASTLVATDVRGELTQFLVLDAAARHAAGHLRQAYDFLRHIGIEPEHELTAAEMVPITVQTNLY